MANDIRKRIRGCAVCGEPEAEVLHRQEFELPSGHPLPAAYDVVACTTCGFCYANTTATQAEYDAYYASQSKYEDKATGSGGGYTPWDAERLAGLAARLEEHGVARDARILDIGCANGGLLRSLREKGYSRLAGVDPSPACVRITRDSGFAAEAGHFLALPASLGKFDCVVLSHVLEHILDLRQAIQAMHPLLSERSLVYIEVPDPSRYGEFLYAPLQDFNVEHINHFSHRSLANLTARCNLRAQAEGSITVRTSADCSYPAIYGLYEYGVVNPSGQPERDEKTRQALLGYVRASEAQLARMDGRIQETLTRWPEILIWGAGQLALKLFRYTSLGSATVLACIDGNAANTGKTIRGVSIVTPEQIPSSSAPIVITSTLHEEAIRRRMHELGLPNPVVSLRD